MFLHVCLRSTARDRRGHRGAHYQCSDSPGINLKKRNIRIITCLFTAGSSALIHQANASKRFQSNPSVRKKILLKLTLTDRLCIHIYSASFIHSELDLCNFFALAVQL